MSGRTRHHDVRRQLFRGITARISHNSISNNNEATSARDDVKGDVTPTSSTTSSHQPTPINNNNNTQNTNNTGAGNNQVHTGLSRTSSTTRAPTKTKRSLLRRNQVITPIPSKSVDTGFTPNSTISSASTTDTADIRGSRPEPIIIKKPEELNSFTNAYDYDYKTFSTNRPLRISKIKAFEQAETTTNLYFAKEDEDMRNEEEEPVVLSQNKQSSIKSHFSSYRLKKSKRDSKASRGIFQDKPDIGSNSSYQNTINNDLNRGTFTTKNNGNENSKDDILIQLPEYTEEETKRIQAQEAKMMKIIRSRDEQESRMDTGDNNDLSDIDDKEYANEYQEQDELMSDYLSGRSSIVSNRMLGDTNRKHQGLGQSNQNPLRPLDQQSLSEMITARKIKDSKIDRKFMNNSQFLNDLNLEELDSWIQMNDEYEVEMNGLKEQIVTRENNKLSTLDTPLDELKFTMNEENAAILREDIRKKVKGKGILE